MDDEPFNILGMQIILSQLEIKGLSNIIDRAYNGEQALEKVQEAFTKELHTYALILTDISMPVMDGFDSSEHIRNFCRANKLPQPMIVACTGHVEEQYINKAWQSEIDEVIPKPVDVESMRAIFETLL